MAPLQQQHLIPIKLFPKEGGKGGLGLYNNSWTIKQKEMQGLNRNGSYVQRRKMYIGFPLHNMKSKIPIDWSIDDRNNQEGNRIRSKEISEKEYIRRVYDQKMEQKIQQRYNYGVDSYRVIPNQNLRENQKDVLTKELEQFNTSKLIPPSPGRNNPEFVEPPPKDIQGESSQSESRFRQEQINRQERVGYDQQPSSRDRYYSEKDKNYSLPRERPRGNSDYERQRSFNAEDRYNDYRDQRASLNSKYPPIQNQGIYQSENYLINNKSIPNPYNASPYKDPYLAQKQHSYNLVKQYRRYAQQQPDSQQNHPFRNILPDRLQSFLREQTKADRKSTIYVPLKNKL